MMIFKEILVTAMAALALGLTGCERFLQVPVAEDEIVFRSEGLAPGTKAAAVSSLASFYVSAVTGSAGADVQAWTSTTFSQVGTSGDYRGGKIWPGSDPSYRFYASNVVMSYAAGGPTVEATNATDVVCAYLPSPTFHETNALTFKHIFSRLGAVTVSADNKYTISDITIWIRDLKTGGTYNLYMGAGHTDGTGWSSLTPAASSDTQVFRYAGSLAPNASQTGSDNALWFVPGSYSLVASWTAHVNDYTGAYVQVTSSAAVAFAAGEENTLSVTLSGDEIRVKLTPLGDQLAWGSGALLSDPVEWTEWPRNIAAASIGTISAYSYDGTAKQPHPTVTYDAETLTEGTHYDISWSNNTNAGTATVTVTGKGIYTGTKSETFTINRIDPTFTWGSSTSKVAATKTYTRTGTANSGGAVTYSSNATGKATVNSTSGLVTGVAEGSATITASVAQTTNYNAKTFSYTVTVYQYITLVTAAHDKGRVVCTDGSVFNTKALAQAAGKTAVAMIGYVSSTGHGLAVALNNAGSTLPQNADATATTFKNNNPLSFSGTWCFPTVSMWNNVFATFGGKSGGTADIGYMVAWNHGTTTTAMSNCGGTAFNIDPEWYWAYEWSNQSQNYRYCLKFSTDYWAYSSNPSTLRYVRCFIQF